MSVDLTETGIPCFECGERSGIDCAGRRSDEATRCAFCMYKSRVKEFFNLYGREELDDKTKKELLLGDTSTPSGST